MFPVSTLRSKFLCEFLNYFFRVRWTAGSRKKCFGLFLQLSDLNPGRAGYEARTLPLCYAVLPNFLCDMFGSQSFFLVKVSSGSMAPLDSWSVAAVCRTMPMPAKHLLIDNKAMWILLTNYIFYWFFFQQNVADWFNEGNRRTWMSANRVPLT